MERSSKLVKFENEFKVVDFDICAIHSIYEQTLWWLATLWQETCVKDEQTALNKIAAILSELTAKKTTMVRLYIAWANKMVLVWLQL
jgi:kinesin family protein 11